MSDELIAVADGVGSWNLKGVDPGIFARELCGHVWALFREERDCQGKLRRDINLKEVLIEGVKRTKAMGTSTFVMAMIEEDERVLKTLNLGDSGVMIVRPKADSTFEVVFRSKEQQYKFNHPYQCGTNYKLPTHSDQYIHLVEHNDLVVVASDGLYDNLYQEDILSCFNILTRETLDVEPTETATCLAKKAETLSFRKDYDSPFAKNAREAGKKHPGGKKDDITVVVAQIKCTH